MGEFGAIEQVPHGSGKEEDIGKLSSVSDAHEEHQQKLDERRVEVEMLLSEKDVDLSELRYRFNTLESELQYDEYFKRVHGLDEAVQTYFKAAKRLGITNSLLKLKMTKDGKRVIRNDRERGILEGQ